MQPDGPWFIPYTCHDKCDDNANVKVCLDRGVADIHWRNIFFSKPGLTSYMSEIGPFPFTVTCFHEIETLPRKSTMRYEVMWEGSLAIPEIIANAWAEVNNIHDLGDVKKSLAKLMCLLHSWRKKLETSQKKVKSLDRGLRY